MKKIWILLGVVLVLLFLGFREGLETTTVIKAPAQAGDPYTPEETHRAIALVPVAERNAFLQSRNVLPTATDDAKYESLKGPTHAILTGFYVETYKPATQQVTPENVDT